MNSQELCLSYWLSSLQSDCRTYRALTQEQNCLWSPDVPGTLLFLPIKWEGALMPCGSGSLFYALSHLLDDDFIPSFLEPTLHTLPPLHPLYTGPKSASHPYPPISILLSCFRWIDDSPFSLYPSIFTSFLKHTVSPFLKTRLKKTHFIPHTRCIFILHLPLLAKLVSKVYTGVSDSILGCSFTSKGFPGDSEGKESARNAGDPGLIPGSGRYPGEGNANPP